MTICWVSERVGEMGGINGVAVKNQLGRPRLDPLTVLVRESAQNSWDAADPSRTGPVTFGIHLRDLDEAMSTHWRRILGAGVPSAENLPLRRLLERPRLTVLLICDSGTMGLGGPTRASAVVEGEPHNYVSFFLNVGDPRDVEYGGGTYGYGKAVHFLRSAASTIVAYTRCTNEQGEDETRLIGCALGKGFHASGCAHTGRHWLGIRAAAGVAEPARGADADVIAAQLGLPPFAADEHGTTIAILEPLLDGRTDAEAMRVVADSILWHLWPKMIARGGEQPPMTFSVTHNDSDVPVAGAEEHPAVREFVGAYDDLAAKGTTITWGPGATPIGRLSLRTTFDPPPIIDDVGKAVGFESGVHHCCLLREPELVVEYRAGPALPDERVWYAGVFRALKEHDRLFADAEPPTHDAWTFESLDGREKSVIRTTLRKIDDTLKRYATPGGRDEATSGSAEGLAAVSRFLGALLAPAAGHGAGAANGGGAAGRPSRRSVQMVGSARWDQHEGRDVLIQEFDVAGGSRVTIEAETTVRVWGGRETEPPIGAGEPALIGWRAPDGVVYPAGRIVIEPAEAGRWYAIVSSPRDTATRIRVREARVAGDG